MFEKIILRSSSNGQPITLGELSEALLFYSKVHLVLDSASITSLVRAIKMEGLLALINRKHVTAVYCDDMLRVFTETVGVMEYHKFTGMTVVGTQDDPEGTNSPMKRIAYTLQKCGYEKKVALSFAKKFVAQVPVRRLTGDDYIKGGLHRAVERDLADPIFTKASVQEIISKSSTQNLEFEVLQSSSDYLVFSNIDFKNINSFRMMHSPELGELTHALILREILAARADAQLAAKYGGDFYTSDIASSIIRLRDASLLSQLGINQSEIFSLTETVLPDSPTVKEALNSGERSFDDFLKVLDKSQKFRDWIQKVHPDRTLLQEYVKSITSEGWVDKLPVKVLRYVMGEVISAISPSVELAVGLADSLLLDKYLTGWRPNHFVEKTLKPFVDK